jgi:hypothetical protein
MTRVNGRPVYVEDGETVILTAEKVALNILFHIEAPGWTNSGQKMAADLRLKCLKECWCLALWVKHYACPWKVSPKCGSVPRHYFWCPDGELPAGYEFVRCEEGRNASETANCY